MANLDFNGKPNIKDTSGGSKFAFETQPGGAPWANITDAHNATPYRHTGDVRYIAASNSLGYEIYQYVGLTSVQNSDIGKLITLSALYQALGISSGSAGSLASTPVSADFLYNAIATNTGGNFVAVSAFSDLSYSTTATSAVVTLFSTFQSFDSTRATVSVYVNDVYNQTITAGINNASADYNITLPSGQKKVTFRAGTQGGGNTLTPIGTFVTKVVFPSGFVSSLVTPVRLADRNLVITDSIGNGLNATIPERYGWIPLVRTTFGSSREIALLGCGGLQLVYYFSTSNRTAILNMVVNYFAGATNKVLTITLGTNDFGFNQTTPTAFQNLLGQFLDLVHTADADIAIKLIKPLPRTDITTNGQGQTLSQFNTAEDNAASGKSWVLVFNPSPWVSSGNYAGDGVHLLNAGQAEFATQYVSNLFSTGSADATLSALTASGITFSPAFSPATISYSQTVPFSTGTTNITATVSNIGATLTINGQATGSGTPRAVALIVGTNIITVVVTSSNGTVTKTYTLTITRNTATTQYVDYGTVATNIIASSNAHEYVLSGGASNGYAVDTQGLTGDFTIWNDINDDLSNDVVAIGVDDNATNNDFTTPWKFTTYVEPTTIRNIHALDNGQDIGAQNGVAQSPVSGGNPIFFKLGFKRTGNTVYLMQDLGGTITILYTYITTPGTTLYCKAAIAATGKKINNAIKSY